MVSHFFCVSSSRVCPKRHAQLTLANRTAPDGNDDAQGPEPPLAALQRFLVDEIERSEANASYAAGSSLARLVRRMENLAHLLRVAQQRAADGSLLLHDLGRTNTSRWQPPEASTSRSDARGCEGEVRVAEDTQRPQSMMTVIVSRYELMAGAFPTWLERLLAALPDGITLGRSRAALHRALSAKFAGAFVADGRHKHRLTPGSNLALLDQSTLQRLELSLAPTPQSRIYEGLAHPTIRDLVVALGYDWPV